MPCVHHSYFSADALSYTSYIGCNLFGVSSTISPLLRIQKIYRKCDVNRTTSTQLRPKISRLRCLRGQSQTHKTFLTLRLQRARACHSSAFRMRHDAMHSVVSLPKIDPWRGRHTHTHTARHNTRHTENPAESYRCLFVSVNQRKLHRLFLSRLIFRVGFHFDFHRRMWNMCWWMSAPSRDPNKWMFCCSKFTVASRRRPHFLVCCFFLVARVVDNFDKFRVI